MAKITHLIRNCSWKKKCSRTWNSLVEAKYMNYELIRFCPDCKEKVHLVADEQDLLQAIESNYCVAIPFDITNLKKQIDGPLLGSIRIDESNF